MGDRDTVVGERYCREALRVIEAAQQLALARNVERIAEIVRHGARELSGADGATFILREGDQCYYADEEAIAPLWKGQRFPADICISGWTMKHGQAVAIEDVYADPRVPIDAFRPTFVKSMLMVPIQTSSPLGAIGNYWAQTHRPSEQETYLLQALANVTAVALENVRLRSGLEAQVKERTAVLENELAERRRMQCELEENRARLAAILDGLSEEVLLATFEQAPVGICHVSREGRFLRVNRKFSEMLGYTEDELRHMHFTDVTYPPDREIGLSEFKRCMAGEIRTFTVEKRYRRRDGTLLWVRVTASSVCNGDPANVRFNVAIVEDITERKLVDAAIQHLNAELEERVRQRTAELQGANEALLHSNMALQRFAHATAHDLQTPLRAIAGFAELLQGEVERCEGTRIKEWSSLVIDNTKRLRSLIDDLLDYTRLDAQGLPFEAVDMREVFEKARDSLSVLIQETGAEVRCGPLPILSVERMQITQLLQNLIENGIKYNRSKPPRVTVNCEFQDDQWLFSVADNGIGIDPRHHERIFEIFRRLHTYSQVPGSGIGLALCRRIAERHGGGIWVESRPGEGSTFYFTLPDRGSQMLNRAP